MRTWSAVRFLSVLLCLTSAAAAQAPQDPAALMTAQRAAMQRLASMDGVWRGPAWTILPSGEKHAITQTERIGPFLQGVIKVIEGRGYDSSGAVTFNALGIVSFDPAKGAYTMRSYAQGRAGDFPLAVTDSGYVWEIPAGPTTIRYTAVIRNGSWHEVGDRIVPGREPVRFFDMQLTRIGDTDWPTGSPVSRQ